MFLCQKCSVEIEYISRNNSRRSMKLARVLSHALVIEAELRFASPLVLCWISKTK